MYTYILESVLIKTESSHGRPIYLDTSHISSRALNRSNEKSQS